MTPHYLNLFQDVLQKCWDKPALTEIDPIEETMTLCYSYAELYQRVMWLGQVFSQLGIRKADHITICGNSSANWAVAYMSIVVYQGVVVTVMPNLSPEEIGNTIRFADTKLLLVDSDIWESIKEHVDDDIQVICLDTFSILGQSVALPPLPAVSKDDIVLPMSEPDDLSLICFTSGSTGKPKGVMLPNRSISANMCFHSEDYPKYYYKNTISLLPFAHVYGLLIDVILPLCMGMNNHIFVVPPPTSSFIFWFQQLKPASTMLVPAIIEALIKKIRNEQSLAQLRVDTLRVLGNNLKLIGIGGASIAPDIESIINYNGSPFAICYGMTECGARVAIKMDGGWNKGSVGKFVPTLEGRIAPNGEILVRGENVMLGYYKDPEATAAKIDKDGWLHTGDRGHLDEDGYLYVEGRLEQDMIVLPSGENISPIKVEAIINACDGVEESIVIARDGKLMALVVPTTTTTSTTTRNELLAQINPQLPAYSQLFGLEFLSEPLARTEKKTIKRYLYK